MVFAVDFDGTLSFGQWPECGPGNKGLIEFLKRRKVGGDKLILWTCREGSDLFATVNWCSDNGLTFDAVNDNLPEVIEMYGETAERSAVISILMTDRLPVIHISFWRDYDEYRI